MKAVLNAGFATAALTLSALATPAHVLAADLHGSIKDGGYVEALPSVRRSVAAGPCYFRGDVGASISSDPTTHWPVSNEVYDQDYNGNGIIDEEDVFFEHVGDQVRNVDLDNTWLAEVGVGCGSGSRGLRGEITFGFRGKQDFYGEPEIYNGTMVGQPNGFLPPDIEDPMHTSIQSHTMMINGYWDFGNIRGFVPYVGAGVGAAWHQVDEVYFTENPNLTNRIEENEEVSFAWAVMAGVGYQVSNRAILDVGYRYIDMGEVKSGRVDNAGFVNPAAEYKDLNAHEIKVGLRYHFGSAGGCCQTMSLK